MDANVGSTSGLAVGRGIGPMRIRFSWIAALALVFTAEAKPPPLLDPVINILEQEKLLGDWLGYRPKWKDQGVDITAQSVTDMFWNTVGGASQGSACVVLFQSATEIDTEKTLGLTGGTFNTTWFWLYGRNPSAYVGDVNAVSGISGNPAFRCYQLWYQQNIAIGGVDDALSLRGGLMGIDAEFFLSPTALLFVNGTFGMPALFSQNPANSGPQYPMATPGLRLAVHPFPWLIVRSDLSQANPFPQDQNLHNFNWNFGPSGGLLSINEVECSWKSISNRKQLPGTAKAGFWIQSGPSPVVPEEWSFGPPQSLQYCTGFYAILDQMLLREQDAACASGGKKTVALPVGGSAVPIADSDDAAAQGLRSFLRVGFCPQPYNPLSLYTDAGLVYTGLIPGRNEDQLGLAFCYGQMSSGYMAVGNQQGVPGPSFESVVELTYSIRLAPAIALQPDLQYVLHPGGSRQYGNALVAGFRAVVDF